MIDLISGDFDFDICEVVIAHKFEYYNSNKYIPHSGGRKNSGFVYCIEGKAFYEFENASLTLEPGQLMYIPRGIGYTVSCEKDKAFYHITVNFDAGETTLDRLLSDGYSGYVGELAVADTFGIYELLEKLVDIWEQKKNGYRIRAKSLVYDLVYRYFSSLGSNSCSGDYYKVKTAADYLDKHYVTNISVGQLASMCGFSETHFRRMFVGVFGVSPAEYRTNKRIERAKDLLMTGELCVSEVADMTGFEDANYFGRIFKKRTGVSPMEFVKT